MDKLISYFQANVQGEFSLLILALCFLGGVVASLSPCGIGMLPVVVSYIGSSSEKRTSKNLIQIIFFILGLSICLSAIGLVCALTGQNLFIQHKFTVLIHLHDRLNFEHIPHERRKPAQPAAARKVL